MRESRPKTWRQGFALHRRRTEPDELGEVCVRYNMEQPDLVVEDGAAEGICWQAVRSWQTASQVSSGLHQKPYGERELQILQGVCHSDALETAAGDRYVIRGAVYELKVVQQWPRHRLFLLERVK